MHLTVVIPSLNPDEKLLQVVQNLISGGFDDIVIVNDGSDKVHARPFEEVGKFPQCTILTHEVNRGKGRALKTAFKFFIENRTDRVGVITVDGDNQHDIEDIMACAKAMLESKTSIILGARNFSQKDVPLRSKLGNKITSYVFKTVCGIKISDTQTGLRAIPLKYLSVFLETHGERFEYETNILLEIKAKDIPFREVKIQTIYIAGNSTSHFNPIIDSVKIYSVILKFFLSSMLSSIIDLSIFAVITNVFISAFSKRELILFGTVTARLISSLFNFLLNRKAVFKSNQKIKITMGRYYVLCVLQMLTSFGLVYLLSALFGVAGLLVTVIKVIVDTVLYFISFQVQREWVFKNK